MELGLDGVGIFEWVNKFSYLGDMIEEGRGCEETSRVRLRGAWCKFRELSHILTKRGASLIVKGRLYMGNEGGGYEKDWREL